MGVLRKPYINGNEKKSEYTSEPVRSVEPVM